jgi:hypothetical protein
MNPYLEKPSGKVGLKVGRRLSLFDLTEPSSPERVGDVWGIQSLHVTQMNLQIQFERHSRSRHLCAGTSDPVGANFKHVFFFFQILIIKKFRGVGLVIDVNSITLQ